MADRFSRLRASYQRGSGGPSSGSSAGRTAISFGRPAVTSSGAHARALTLGNVETLTFLFTDIEGSTTLLRRVGEGVYARVLADHHAVIRSALAAHGGRELNTMGDGFFAAFSSLRACVAAVLEMQQALEARAWPAGEHVRVRMGAHR